MVVVLDPGDRVQPASPTNYRVPLLLVRKDIKGEENFDLLSRLDLTPILNTYLFNTPHPHNSTQMRIVLGCGKTTVYFDLPERFFQANFMKIRRDMREI